MTLSRIREDELTLGEELTLSEERAIVSAMRRMNDRRRTTSLRALRAFRQRERRASHVLVAGWAGTARLA